MQISKMMIAIDDELELAERAVLAGSVVEVPGVYQVYYHYKRPHCHGLLVKFDPNLVQEEEIIAGVKEEMPAVPWWACNPEVDCPNCQRQ